ncbi:MAG: hypothetical protein ACKVJU_11720 [Verrucomicrobiales bacterium]
MTQVVWTLRAECDLQRLYESEDDFIEGRGYELLAVVKSGDDLLSKNPNAGPLFELPFHRLVLSNPRFGVFYVHEDRGVIVHALCNLAKPKANILRHLGLPTG